MKQIIEEIIMFVFLYFYQSILYVFGIHLFCNHPIRWKPFFLCTVLSMIVTYLARILLTFGNHTLFSLIFLILLSIAILKIPAQKVVKSSLLIAIITFIYEGIIFFIFSAFIGVEEFRKLFKTNNGRIITGLLSNLLLTITLFSIYFYKKRKAQRKGE